MNTEVQQETSKVRADGGGSLPLGENHVPSLATKAAIVVTEHNTKRAEQADSTPIATLVFRDGRTEPVYQPLAGHEHLFQAQPKTVFSASSSDSMWNVSQIEEAPYKLSAGQHAYSTLRTNDSFFSAETIQGAPCWSQKKVVTSALLAASRQTNSAKRERTSLGSKDLKRTRSIAQGFDAAAGDTDPENMELFTEKAAEESYTFYIGDTEAFKKFLRRRFNELTMKPLRDIAKEWIKLIEPRRLGHWGKYHNMKPSEAKTPPWWPQDVIYKEPSHLTKEDLFTLAIEMMLLHQKTDEIKRKEPWTSKLKDKTELLLKATPEEHFSSSKGADHSIEMKKRALEQILPSIFEVAQAYEDHVLQHGLFEGSGKKDPRRGKRYTCMPIPLPERRRQFKKPRPATQLELAEKLTVMTSGDGIETDYTISRPPRSLTKTQALSMLECPPPQTASKTSTPSASFVSSLESIANDCVSICAPSALCYSFDSSMNELHLQKQDPDVEPHAQTRFDDASMRLGHASTQPCYNVSPTAEPTHYSAVQYQSADHSTNQALACLQNDPPFVTPYPAFGAPLPSMPIPYGYFEQDMYGTPISYLNTAMNMSMTPGDAGETQHGLLAVYSVPHDEVHHF